MSVKVAIVGSGPSGFYVAKSLLDKKADVSIDLIERLPTPFGLIRSGVAPDHQKTKKVAEAFERTAMNERVRYYGNAKLGEDFSLAELRETYDAVVLAVGMPGDRKLGIPGEDLQGVIGASSFVGWYNGHPSAQDLNPDLDIENVVVIGNGNVSIDVARVLVKNIGEMEQADMPHHLKEMIDAAPITDVFMVGRRGPADAKFTNVELREMGQLEDACSVVDLRDIPQEIDENIVGRERRLCEKNLEVLRGYAALDASDKPKKVHFVFFAKPVEVLGTSKVEGIRMEKTQVCDGRAEGTGEFFDIPCGLVIPAIGYASQPVEGAPLDDQTGAIKNDGGRIADGLYVVGWAKRGPSGVIGTNKPDGVLAAEQILEDAGGQDKPGRAGFEKMLKERDVNWVDLDGWRQINDAEVKNAFPGAPREKFVTTEDMLSLLANSEPKAV